MKLKYWLNEQQLSASEFARAINVPVNTVIQIANKGVLPRLDIAIKIVEASCFEVGYRDLLNTRL